MRSDTELALDLFRKSVLKRQKYDAIVSEMGPTDGMRCLDIGSDNGVISYLFRQRGGLWKSADLDENTVEAIRRLVKTEVHLIDGKRTPFADDEFDLVVIVDFLEHVHTDKTFVEELFRIIRPGGTLIVNVPNVHETGLRRFRLAIGQTDEKHGHVRPGYTKDGLDRLLEPEFTLLRAKTYSKFFSECIDTFITAVTSGSAAHTQKGAVITADHLRKMEKMYRFYSVIHPFFWLFSQLDRLLRNSEGYKIVARAGVNKLQRPAGRVREGRKLHEIH